jgi:hypothetical protein
MINFLRRVQLFGIAKGRRTGAAAVGASGATGSNSHLTVWWNSAANGPGPPCTPPCTWAAWCVLHPRLKRNDAL